MKKLLLIIAALALSALLAGCVIGPETKEVEVDVSKVDPAALPDSETVPAYFPRETADGKATAPWINTDGEAICLVKSGTATLATISYVELASADASLFPELGKAKLDIDGGSITVHMLLSETLACEIACENLSAEEVEKMINTFYTYGGD